MRRTTISLDGAWERRDFIDEAWRWSDALHSELDATGGPPAKAALSAGWRPARVPGSAIDDAWRAGEIPNPYLDRNSLAAEWVPQRTWLYRRRFTVPESVPHAALRFEGLDPGGIVHVDGVEIARHRGMFVPLDVALPANLEPRVQHTLVVAVDPAPPMPSQVSRTDLAREHRSRMGYGWDFCPRMIHTGIWRPVTLELFTARIVQPRVAIELAEDHSTATITATATVEGDAATTVAAQIEEPDGAIVAEARAPAEGGAVRIGLELDAPQLWWPNGLGVPAMHRLILRLEGDEVLDERVIPFGLRSIAVEPNDGAPADALPYTLVVNGRRTWIRGWNWTQIDACFGVPREDRMRHLVELARRASVNLLRVWGGGLIESDDFYDACDRAGILVRQEFAQSSSGVANTPSDDPAFVELMRREAEAIVPLRANHPSLAIWCGGNELADPDGRPLTDAHPILAALHEVVARLDPIRAWLPTSPSGPRFDNSLDAVADDPDSLHDVHGPWEHQGLAGQHTLAMATTSLLHSEFGVEGMTNLPALRATVTDPERWTADRSDPVMAHRGAWWNNKAFVEAAFGGDLTLEELERCSQHLQADGLRTMIEGDRRRWPRNAGSLPWVFNEPFPNAWSNAAIDYFGVPKAAYWAVAAAYAPVLIGLDFDSQALEGADRFAVTAWIVNDTDAPLRDTLVVSLYDGAGRRIDDARQPIEVEPNTVATAREVVFGVPPDAADLLILDAAFGDIRTRRLLSRTATLAPLRDLPLADLAASVRADGHRWSVRLRLAGRIPAPELRLADERPIGWPDRSGTAYFETNLITMLPGELRTIGVAWDDVPATDRRLKLSGWNVAERVLTDG